MNNNSQYLQMFFDESEEYIQLLNENVLLLEEQPQDQDIINSIFRAAHSVKGMAATMGFEKLTDLTHKIENMLAKVRNKELKINEDIIDILFHGLDNIKLLVEDISVHGQEQSDVSEYIEELTYYLNNGKTKETSIEQSSTTDVDSMEEVEDTIEEGNLQDMEDKAEENKDKEDTKDLQEFKKHLDLNENEEKTIRIKMREQDSVYYIEVILEEDCLLKNVRGYMVLKNTQQLGYLVKSSPNQEEIEDEDFGFSIYIILVSSESRVEILNELADIIDVAEVKVIETDIKKKITDDDTVEEQKAVQEDEDSKEYKKTKNRKKTLSNVQVSPTVRVDINKLDTLMNMVGELLINKTRLQGLDVKNDVFHDIVQQLDRVTTDLHHNVMQIRMVPIGGIFNRFPRMVRDISKDLHKDIDLIIEGADTELDRSIIDELGDPLIHLIRNSIDHGIETSEERKKKGKPETGSILLNAYQKGSEIVIEVEDDGAGISTEIIVNKALEKGIISSSELDEMDERDKLHLIFHPGFSTSSEITDVSGRGVGTDVVKRVVESLDGQVFIETEKDVGTRFTISLPLTLAITQALMVTIDSEVFAIPLNAISETFTANPRDFQQVRGQDVILLRDITIPIVEGAKQLNLDIEYGTYHKKNEVPVVIINSGERQIGLIVDDLLNQQEIVIKSLGNYLIDIKNISGATIVGDGDVALILDVRNIA